MAEIPRIVTARLILRRMQASDWPGYLCLMSSPRSGFMGGPFTDAAAWGMFCADHAQWDFFGCGALMIEEAATGACLGQVGINAGPLFPEHEIGWMLYPQAEGRGIAFEAASALRNWAQQTRKLATLVSYVDPGNARSCRLAERLGARLDPHAPRPDAGDLVFRHFGQASLPA